MNLSLMRPLTQQTKFLLFLLNACQRITRMISLEIDKTIRNKLVQSSDAIHLPSL